MSFSQPKSYDIMYGWSVDRAIQVLQHGSKDGFTVDDVIAAAKKLADAAGDYAVTDESQEAN